MFLPMSMEVVHMQMMKGFDNLHKAGFNSMKNYCHHSHLNETLIGESSWFGKKELIDIPNLK
jgi:hypothetical protein